jgi:pimeloyl-ACP methyl ester carboxylesterase
MPEIKLSQGTIDYGDDGSGPAVVFVHGLLVNGGIWDGVVSRMRATARCIVPELPLGAHRRALDPGADASPLGVAGLIAELLERLELSDVTLVGNDTGGALCQLVIAHHPERIGRLALTNCDAFENFPPRPFRLAFKALSRVPGAMAGYELLGRSATVRRDALRLAPLTVAPIPDATVRGWIEPLRDRGVRRDVVSVMRGISPAVTLAAAERFAQFERPVLIAWGTRDKFFKLADGERLAASFPAARLERIDDARTFVQLDAPERLAELLAEFVPRAAGANSADAPEEALR